MDEIYRNEKKEIEIEINEETESKTKTKTIFIWKQTHKIDDLIELKHNQNK